MAAKSGANAAGTSAGQVYVSLRADLSQLESDLNKAKSMVAGTAKTGTTGVAGGADVIVAAKAQAQAQDTIATGAARSSAAISQVGFASREAARDVRTQVATIKDQLNDTTAFSGAGFSDLLFGIDNDRIATTRFGGALADLQKQKVRLDAELIRDPGNKALVQQLFEVNKGIRLNQDGLDGIQKKWSGVGGAARGAAATISTSLASSFLIGAGIGLATTAIQFLVETLTNVGDRMANPAKYAAAAFNTLASAINKAGSADGLSKLLGLSGPLGQLASQTELAAANQERLAQLNTLVAAASSAGASGMTPQQALTAGNQQAFTSSVLSGINMLGNIPVGLDEQKATDIAKLLGTEAFAAFKRDLESQKGTFGAGTFTMGLVDALKVAAKVAFTTMQADIKAVNISSRDELIRQRQIAFGVPGVQLNETERAKASIASDQARLNAISAGGQYAQMNRSLADARLAVARAGVSGGQETVFDVAIRRSEALENLKRAREDASRQRASLALQTRIADKTAALEAKTKDAEMVAAINALTKQIGDGFVITSEGAAPTKDEVAKAVNTLNTYWVGRTTRMIPK